jgi:hypothetical protein
VREKSSKKVQRKSKAKKAPKVKEEKKVGRKLNAAIQQVYALNVEAFTKIENSPSDYSSGYAMGLTEALRTMREIEKGNYFKFPLLNIKKKK